MQTENDKEIQQLKKRIRELSEKSYAQGIYTYTSFLSLPDQEVFYQMEKELAGSSYELFGGYQDSERKMLRFGSPDSLSYEESFPITGLRLSPLLEKFAEELTHRDYLGAVMNLGIERSLVGDIVIQGKSALLFCAERIAPYLTENLTKVRHTNIKAAEAAPTEAIPAQEAQTLSVTVSSERIDGVVAKVCAFSRTQSLSLFQMGKIYVNGRQTEQNSYQLKPGDSVTVRGFGKFVYSGISHETKKGKLSVTVMRYR